MKSIILTKEQIARVDDEDYKWLNKLKWHAVLTKSGYYAETTSSGINFLMHRLIMNPKNKEEIDHIDFDGLNNQKSNLRICSHQQNMFNRKKQKNNISGFIGVIKDKRIKKWIASIGFNNHKIYLGSFDNKLSAKRAYDKKAKELFKEFRYKGKE